jgi:predicted  nucleic acid-binding Zn-ribbon protein
VDNQAAINNIWMEIRGHEQRIDVLKNEIHDLRKRWERIDASRKANQKRKDIFEKGMAQERKQVKRIQETSKIRLAAGYANYMNETISGSRYSDIGTAFGEISRKLESAIQKINEEISAKNREIGRLESEINRLRYSIQKLSSK